MGNLNNFLLYDKLLKIKHGKRSKCPIRGTFFVKHDYNNYAMIEELYYRGNEIAVNSVTGRNLQYENASIWKEEIEGQRNLLGELANIPAKDILGVRAESLKPGFNKQFEALIEANFLWDSSISTKTTEQPIWPYTLDYAIPHECKIKSCPTKSFPGVWEIPVNLHYVSGLEVVNARIWISAFLLYLAVMTSLSGSRRTSKGTMTPIGPLMLYPSTRIGSRTSIRLKD